MKSTSYRQPLTLLEVNRQSERSRMGIRDFENRYKKLTEDAEKDRRVARRLCKYCHYLGGRFVGHAFTEFNCAACSKEVSWPNTGVPQLCDECSDRHKLCQVCMGDREMKDRRKDLIQSAPDGA